MENPLRHGHIAFAYFSSKTKQVSSIANTNNSQKTIWSIPFMISLSLKSSSQMMPIVSFDGMFVNRGVTSSEDMEGLGSKSTLSLGKENESLTVYSLVVIGSMIRTRNWDSLCVSVPIIEMISRNVEKLSRRDF